MHVCFLPGEAASFCAASPCSGDNEARLGPYGCGTVQEDLHEEARKCQVRTSINLRAHKCGLLLARRVDGGRSFAKWH